MNRTLSLSLRSAIAIALTATAPLASAQDAARRHFDEPAWSEFVYEKIGATPSVRFGRNETPAAPAQAAVKPAAAARDFDFDLGTAAGRQPTAAPDMRNAQSAQVAVKR
ncbi:MAG: hypothetical protein ACK5TK_09650 [Betaproteobacteria bacterium]